MSERLKQNSSKVVQVYSRDTINDDWVPVDNNNPLPVSVTGGSLQTNGTGTQSLFSIENVINQTNYSLDTSAFLVTTNITYDYILENIELNFSTNALKTITISSSSGIIWGGDKDKSPTNLGYNSNIEDINLTFGEAFNANENITILVTQTIEPCLMSCITRVRKGTGTGAGDIVLADSSNVVGTFYEFGLQVSKNKVLEHKGFNSLGERESIGIVIQGTDIWQGNSATIPFPSTLGEQLSLVSTSASDTNGGTGINTIKIHYLNSSGLESTEIVTLNGLTTVDTIATNIRFVQVIHSTSVGTNLVAVGDVTIFKKGDPTKIYNVIKVGGNMSLSSAKMVPANKNFYLQSWKATAIGKQPVTLRLRSTDYNGQLYDGNSPVFIFKDTISLDNMSSPFIRFTNPISIPSLSIVKVTGWTSQAGAGTNISYDGYLVDI